MHIKIDNFPPKSLFWPIPQNRCELKLLGHFQLTFHMELLPALAYLPFEIRP